MALPVVLYPAAILSSFAALLIPEITEQNAAGNKEEIRYIAGRAYQTALLFSIGTAAIMLFLSGELGEVLYSSTEVARFIRLLAPLIPIMYIDTATDAMLKGLGEQVYSMKINIIDAALSVALVLLLIPTYGITGYIITIYVSEFFNTVFSITKLLCMTKTKPHLLKWIYKPLLCIVIATVTVHGILMRMPSTSLSAGRTVLHCTAVLGCYLLLLCLTRSIEKDDLTWLRALFQAEKDANDAHTHAKKR